MKEKTLKDYIDIYKDRDIFVFGTGPSLYKFCEHPAMKNTGFIEKQITLAVNESIMRIVNPTYYFTSDGNSVYFSYWNYVLRGNFPVIAGSQGAEMHIKQSGNLKENREVCFYQKKYEMLLDKKADALIFGITSPHCAVHFAHILGAGRIIIIGCDCCKEDGNIFSWQYPGEEKYTTNKPNIQKGAEHDRVHVGWMNESYRYWKNLKKHNSHVNIMAWGGRLETLFPKWHG